jgi:membrane-associated HD superfamily phosphohydrolase
MNKEKKYNLYAITSALVTLTVILIYSEFLCGSSDKCYDLEVIFLEPLFFGTLGLIPTLLILLWRGEIFVSWLKHIAWWNILVALFIVSSNENEGFLSPIENDSSVILACSAFLFIITIIYALVMKMKVSNNS